MTFVKKVLGNTIFKNLSVLVSGTVLAQLFVIAFQIVLRRLYSPADFGAFAVYMSVVGIFITIASLRYEQAIVLPKQHSDGIKLAKMSVLIAAVLVLVFSIFLFFFAKQFMYWVGLNTDYTQWLALLPLTLLVFSVYQTVTYLLIRLKRFKVLGSNKVIRRAIEGSAQTGMGYSGIGIGLILGDIVGHLVIITRSVFKIKRLSNDFTKTNLGLKDLAKRYKDFPIKSSLPSLMNAFSRLLPVIIISRLFSADITGFFDLARVVLIVPLSLVTVSLNQVLLQQFSQAHNQNRSVKKEALGIFALLLAGAIVFVLAIKLWGTFLFTGVFGDNWLQSGQYAEVLVWAFGIKFLISPFNACFVAFEKIGIGSIWQAIYFAMVLSLFFIPFSNIIQFIKTYMLIEVAAFIIAGIMNFSILHRYENNLKRQP